jgi:hypothetical protein
LPAAQAGDTAKARPKVSAATPRHAVWFTGGR